jgi:hypothetical protein
MTHRWCTSPSTRSPARGSCRCASVATTCQPLCTCGHARRHACDRRSALSVRRDRPCMRSPPSCMRRSAASRCPAASPRQFASPCCSWCVSHTMHACHACMCPHGPHLRGGERGWGPWLAAAHARNVPMHPAAPRALHACSCGTGARGSQSCRLRSTLTRSLSLWTLRPPLRPARRRLHARQGGHRLRPTFEARRQDAAAHACAPGRPPAEVDGSVTQQETAIH